VEQVPIEHAPDVGLPLRSEGRAEYAGHADRPELPLRLTELLEMFTDLAPVLDLGCGRGEFLSLLDDAGIKGQGVGSDDGMVEKARARGFEVACEDAIEYLHGDPAPGSTSSCT